MDAVKPASAFALSSHDVRLFARAWILGFLIVMLLVG
jgi:hypothetical protein